MNQDVMLAILAMDAYNQGNFAGVEGVGETIGTASYTGKFKTDNDASFYALSYSWNGKTIVSYRGTDKASWSGDIPSWATGLGQPYTQQTWLAASFYQEITQTVDPANVILTGHSLGGGLAGFVGSLYGVNGVLFDNMAFEAASSNLFQAAIGSTEMPSDPLALEYYPNGNVSNINRSGLRTVHVDGESLELNRLLQATEDEEIGWGGTVSALTGRQLHSQSLLVLLLYAQHELADNGVLHWQSMMPTLLPALFDEGIAAAAGANQFKGSATIDDTMRSMIAYSAIDEGTRPFGDSAIRALFDDANQVGTFLEAENVSQTLQETASSLSKIVSQYAGQLAVWKDTSASGKEGVLSVEQNLLVADLSAAKWNPGGEGSGTIAAKPMLTYQLVSKALGSTGMSDPSHLLTDVWGDNSSDQFNLVAFAASKDAFDGFVPARSGGTQSDKVTLILTDEGDDHVQGSAANELIAGMDGNDVLIGGGGKDLLIGGAGNDILIGKDQSYLLGGPGSDHLKAESGAVTLDGGPGNDYLEATGDGPVTYVFGKGSGHDVLGSMFAPAPRVDFLSLPLWETGDGAWVEQRQYDTIQLKGLSPGNLVLEWDYEQYYWEDHEDGGYVANRCGPAAIKILSTGDTLYLGNIYFASWSSPSIDDPNEEAAIGYLSLGWEYYQRGWAPWEEPLGNGLYDLNLFQTADGTRYDILDLFDFKNLTNIVHTTLPAEYYSAAA